MDESDDTEGDEQYSNSAGSYPETTLKPRMILEQVDASGLSIF